MSHLGYLIPRIIPRIASAQARHSLGESPHAFEDAQE